jgi:patatin-like phospholipase/acyl hydrolase
MSVFRILSLDGGGIRGIYTAVLLDRLTREVPEFWDGIHLFAGTSTGGILALGFAYGQLPADGIQLYRTEGPKVFSDSLWDNIKDLWGLIGAQYNHAPLQKALEAIFHQDTLEDIFTRRQKYVLIPTFDLDAMYNDIRTWKPKFFHNFPGEDSDGQEKIVDVALRTTAAPTLFPTYQGYIDGGAVANNPSMAALTQTLDPRGVGRSLTDIRLFSLGTGDQEMYIPGETLDWGYVQWAKPLLSVLLEGSMEVADYQCLQILSSSRYHRLAPSLREQIGWDAVDKIDRLIELANRVDIAPTVEWLRQNFI